MPVCSLFVPVIHSSVTNMQHRWARATGGLYVIYICTSTHTSFFGPSIIFVVYPEVLNKCDHILVLIIKNAEYVLTQGKK